MRKVSLAGLLAGFFVLQSAAQQPATPAKTLVQIRVLEVSRMMAQMSQEALSALDYAQLYESCVQKPAPAELAAAPRDKLVVARAMLGLTIERQASSDADVNEWAEQCKQRIMKRMGPRGRYYNPAEFERFQKFGRGFVLGLVPTRFNGEWVVREVRHQAVGSFGIRVGDTLESIDGVRVRDITYDQLLEALSDRSGSLAAVVWHPPGKPSQRAAIQRGAVTREATVFAQKFADHTYIRISSFGESTPRELAAALREQKLDGTTKRVLDLRGNPGGLLVQAQWVLAVLGDSTRAKNWFAVKYRPDAPNAKMFSASDSLVLPREQGPQISEDELRTWAFSHNWLVLTDGETGSGAAWLAGALRELNDVVLVGQVPDPANFGVDTIRPVSEAGGISAMRYEVGHLALPSGKVLAPVNTAPDLPLRQTIEIIQPYPRSGADWLQDPVYLQIKDRLR